MDRVQSSVVSGRLWTYLGLIDFIDDQSRYDSAFVNDLIMLCITRNAAGTCVIEDNTYFGES